jgi:hypothetical protein
MGLTPEQIKAQRAKLDAKHKREGSWSAENDLWKQLTNPRPSKKRKKP